MTPFFQLITREDELGDYRVERVGLVSLERAPTRQEVIDAIGADARGEFVEWETLVVNNGQTLINYYAAFEHRLDYPQRAEKIERAPRAQMRMEM